MGSKTNNWNNNKKMHKNRDQREVIEGFEGKDRHFESIVRSIMKIIICKDSSKDIWGSFKKKYHGTTRKKR
jgi:hypothetical protein